MMRQEWILIGTLYAIIVGLAMPSASQAAQGKRPCEQITTACRNADFVQGGEKAGNGLRVDCVGRIMQGTSFPGARSHRGEFAISSLILSRVS